MELVSVLVTVWSADVVVALWAPGVVKYGRKDFKLNLSVVCVVGAMVLHQGVDLISGLLGSAESEKGTVSSVGQSRHRLSLSLENIWVCFLLLFDQVVVLLLTTVGLIWTAWVHDRTLLI